MADETAASSTATAEEVDVFNGQEPTLAEYHQYRQSGEVPSRFKPAEIADPAPAATSEETTEPEDEESEDAPAAEPEETQEQPQKGAEKRIKQLLAQKKELERKLADAAKPTHTGSSPAQQNQAPQNYQEYRSSFKPADWVAKYAEKNPQATYEDANAAMADHLADARDHFRNIEQRVAAQVQALEAKVSEARERYEDFDEIKTSFLSKTLSDQGAPLIPLGVLGIINDSEVMADLLYVIGSDEAELAKFVALAKVNPNKAIRYVARVESLITEERAKPEVAERSSDGKFKAPEPKKTTAPKPPSPVGGASTRAFDVSDESLSPEEWMRKRTADLEKRKRS